MHELNATNSPDFLLASFLSGDGSQADLAILTGPSGAGKTRWCQELWLGAKQRGIHPVGLLSPAVFSSTGKVGIDLCDLATGEQRRLADRHPPSSPIPGLSQYHTSQWAIHDQTIAWGNQILSELDHPAFLLIDELGPLEFERGLGLVAGLAQIDRRQYRQAVAVIRPALLDQALARWPWAGIIRLMEAEAAR